MNVNTWSNAMIRDGFDGFPLGYEFPKPAVNEAEAEAEAEDEYDEDEQEWLFQNPNAGLDTRTSEDIQDSFLIELSKSEKLF